MLGVWLHKQANHNNAVLDPAYVSLQKAATRLSAPSAIPNSGLIVSQESEWDAFVSHAREDKEILARPLVNALRACGLRIWFDEYILTIGDSLRRSIDRGLAHSRFGIVIISPDFLQKDWPQRELDGLVGREVNGVKVILPVWHGINADGIRRYSPMLADRLAASTSKGLDHVVEEIMRAIQRDTVPPLKPVSAGALELAQTKPLPSPFSDMQPKDGPGKFRLKGQRLGMTHIYTILGQPEHDVRFSDTPVTWLRVMPVNDPGRTWLVTELESTATKIGRIVPLVFDARTNLFFFRDEDGFGVCWLENAQKEVTNTAVYAFSTGEIWALDSYWLEGTKPHNAVPPSKGPLSALWRVMRDSFRGLESNRCINGLLAWRASRTEGFSCRLHPVKSILTHLRHGGFVPQLSSSQKEYTNRGKQRNHCALSLLNYSIAAA